MLNIKTKTEGAALTVILAGRLDTTTAPQLEKLLKEELDGLENLTIDMAELDYISSAGLRVLLFARKAMDGKGSLRVTHVNETIMEIFEVTGFADILTIE